MFSSRGLRVVKALERYAKDSPMYFDTSTIFNKIKFTSLNDERLQATFKVDSSMCNGSNVIHGGYIALIVDVTCVYAFLGKTNGKIGLTTNLFINYIRSAQKGEQIMVEVKTLKSGTTPLLEACLYRECGTIVAKGTTSFVIGNEQFQKHCAETLKLDFMIN